jgi:hypothetical protein
VRAADPFECLLVVDALGAQRAEVALLDEVAIDLAGLEQHGGDVGLLGDQHRHPRVTLAVADQAVDRAVVDRVRALPDRLTVADPSARSATRAR